MPYFGAQKWDLVTRYNPRLGDRMTAVRGGEPILLDKLGRCRWYRSFDGLRAAVHAHFAKDQPHDRH